MKKNLKFIPCLMLIVSLMLAGCLGTGNAPAESVPASDQPSPSAAAPAESPAAESSEAPAEVEEMVIITRTQDAYWGEIEQMLVEQFPQYRIIMKDWVSATAERDIKTTISAGNPCDVAMYWPNYMPSFIEADMAMDLTPYLEADGGAWKNVFTENTLEIGKYDGKYYNIAYCSVYPMMIANKTLLEQAGITIADPENWSWDEFIATCNEIQEKLPGVFPYTMEGMNANWFTRNGMLMAWDDEAEMEKFCRGEISFTDPRILESMEMSKTVFDNYAYPGPGAATISLDEAKSAWQQGKAVIMGSVNASAGAIIKDCGIDNALILAWPMMGPTPTLLGGCDGFFIPSNVKNPEASVEIIKYLTSPEVLQCMVDADRPVTAKDCVSTDPNFALYSRETSRVTSVEVINLSNQIFDIVVNKMPSEYIYNGAGVIDELEKERLAAIA